jgi:peroxiredoxin Q/BCP
MSGESLENGALAPEFTLKDQDGADVSLADFAGRWVVLYFYPKDDTPGCTTEACEFTDGIAAFTGLGADVLGCSPDSPASHQRFITKHGLRLRLLSDPDHTVMQRYGAWGEKTRYGKKTVGVIRSTALIDPSGRIAHRWPNVKAAGHAAKVRETLAELRGRVRG